MSMTNTLALLGQRKASVRKRNGGRPSKIGRGLNPDDKNAWMLGRALVVLEVVERVRAEGKSRKVAALAAVLEWKRLFPMGKLSLTEVDNILSEYQPEHRPDTSLRAVRQVAQMPEFEMIDGKMRLTGRWETRPVLAFRFDERPPYPKRGSGKKVNQRFSKRYK